MAKQCAGCGEGCWLVQIGTHAERNPDGSFKPSQPIYIIAGEQQVKRSGLTQDEEDMLGDFAREMASEFGKYVEATGMDA